MKALHKAAPHNPGPPHRPTRFLVGGWCSVLRRTLRDISQHYLMDEAGGIAFFALLALVPALTALVSLRPVR